MPLSGYSFRNLEAELQQRRKQSVIGNPDQGQVRTYLAAALVSQDYIDIGGSVVADIAVHATVHEELGRDPPQMRFHIVAALGRFSPGIDFRLLLIRRRMIALTGTAMLIALTRVSVLFSFLVNSLSTIFGAILVLESS